MTEPFPALNSNFCKKVVLVAAIYLLVQSISFLVTQNGWTKYAVLAPPDSFQYWDASIYAQLSLVPACTAFYPLWSGFIQILGSPDTLLHAIRVASFTSEGLFLLTLPLALYCFERILKNSKAAFLCLFLYALGPNAIFYGVGYTESLFGLWSCLLLLTIHQFEQVNHLSQKQGIFCHGTLFLLTVLMNLTRPALVQSWAAIACTLGVLVSFQFLSVKLPGRSQLKLGQMTRLAANIGCGSIVGYSLYGLYCWHTTGSFLEPFHAQVDWGRSLAFRPWLLLFPRSLLIDIHGLYAPALLCAALIWLLCSAVRKVQMLELRLPRQPWLYIFLVHPLVFTALFLVLNRFAKRCIKITQIRPKLDWISYLGRFSILYAIAFSSVHSLINFVANSGHLYSTSRHFFASPFAYVGIGAVLSVLSVPHLNRVMWIIGVVGVGLLAQQWFSYATDGWLG